MVIRNGKFDTRHFIPFASGILKARLTCASSWITRYCSFHTVILETSSFLSARSFFSSGLQKVLMEFMEELSLLSLTSTSRCSISFSRRTWQRKKNEGVQCKFCIWPNTTSMQNKLIKKKESKKVLFLSLFSVPQFTSWSLAGLCQVFRGLIVPL